MIESKSPIQLTSTKANMLVIALCLFTFSIKIVHAASSNKLVPIINMLVADTGPFLKNEATSISATSANILWRTEFPTTGRIEYGKTRRLDQSTRSTATSDIAHTQLVSGLEKFTVYYYRIVAKDENGNIVQSPIASFKTKPHDIDLSKAVLASAYGFDANDATLAFTQAIESDHAVVIIDKQASDWLIQPHRFFSLKNKTVVFEEGVVVRAKPGAFPGNNDIMIDLLHPENVKFLGYGATLTMNKHEYTTGENRHALVIHGGRDVTIEGFTLSNSGGDGLWIGDSSERTYSKDIYIDNIIADNNRRQGMSIISGENIWVSNSTFKNTKGTLPEAGVDLEPNKPTERLVNINFDNCRFFDNYHAGFVVAAFNLTADSLPISVNVTNSYFSKNHHPSNRYTKAEIAFSSNRNSPVAGTVLFENIEFDGSDWGIFSTRKTAEGYGVKFKNIVARNLGQASLGQAPRHGLFTYEVATYDDGDQWSMGNVEFENVEVDYSATNPVFYIYDFRTLAEIKNITGDIRVINPNRIDTFIFHNNLATPQTNVDLDITFAE